MMRLPLLLLLALGLSGSTAAQEAAPDAGAEDEGYSKAPPMEDLTQGKPSEDNKPAAEQPLQQAASGTASAARKQGGGINEVNGYLDSRSQFGRSRVRGLVPTQDLAQLDELIEANVQLKHSHADRGFVYGDISVFGQFAGNYRALGPDGNEITIPAHDVATVHPLISLNEFYLSQDIGNRLNLMVGKKRVVWGPGFAFNPTDLINPPKDPTDPTFQRAGAWMARAEENLGDYAFTLLAAPAVTESASGIPFAFVKYPGWDPQDTQSHYLFAARAYALIANSDLNLMAFYSNRYNDAFEHKFRVGASFARYFFTDWQLYGEALFQKGSVKTYPNGQCGLDEIAASLCGRYQTNFLDQTRLTDPNIYPRVVAGLRRQFDDESLLTVEYYFQADGYTRTEFQAYVNQLELNKQSRQLAPAIPNSGIATTTSGGIPQKFTFDPLERHYLIVNYSKPKIFDDWTAGVVIIANLTDLSTFVTPSISWSTTEYLTLSLLGFIPIPGPDSLAARTSAGGHFSEYSLIPSYYRVLFEARVFY